MKLPFGAVDTGRTEKLTVVNITFKGQAEILYVCNVGTDKIRTASPGSFARG